LTGWLNDKETRGALYVLNEVKNTIISISNPNEDKKKISLEVLQSKGQANFEKRNGSILFRISIRQKVNIGEIQGEIDLTKKDTIKKIEENANQYVENEIREAIEKMQVDYQADVLGFGEIINKKAPGLWKELEGSWDKVFSKIPVEIEVETITTRSGYTQNPPKPK
jgi:spore germination protein KC